MSHSEDKLSTISTAATAADKIPRDLDLYSGKIDTSCDVTALGTVVWLIIASVYRSVGRYRHASHKKSMTTLKLVADEHTHTYHLTALFPGLPR